MLALIGKRLNSCQRAKFPGAKSTIGTWRGALELGSAVPVDTFDRARALLSAVGEQCALVFGGTPSYLSALIWQDNADILNLATQDIRIVAQTTAELHDAVVDTAKRHGDYTVILPGIDEQDRGKLVVAREQETRTSLERIYRELVRAGVIA